MLYFNFFKLFKARNIKTPRKFLRENGLTENQAQRLLTIHTRALRLDTIEKICLALNCTPNDLLEWKPASANLDFPETALHSLKPKDTIDFTKIAADIPLEKLPELKSLVQKFVADNKK